VGVAAPGEAIVSTYRTDTYAAGWGTSFSAPLCRGGAVLLHKPKLPPLNQSSVALRQCACGAFKRTVAWDTGRLDLCAKSRVSVLRELFTGLSVFCGAPSATIMRDADGPSRLRDDVQSSTSDCDWSCTGAPASIHVTPISPASVNARREERRHSYGDLPTMQESWRAIGRAAICAADAYMGDVGCMLAGLAS